MTACKDSVGPDATMFATLTSQGQLTLPKEIRDRLNLDAGAILDFQVQADNTITARHVQPDARRIRGLLKSPHAGPLTVEQMDALAKQMGETTLFGAPIPIAGIAGDQQSALFGQGAQRARQRQAAPAGAGWRRAPPRTPPP